MWCVEIKTQYGGWQVAAGQRNYCQGYIDAQREFHTGGSDPIVYRLIDSKGKERERFVRQPRSPAYIKVRLLGRLIQVTLFGTHRDYASAYCHGLVEALKIACQEALNNESPDEGP